MKIRKMMKRDVVHDEDEEVGPRKKRLVLGSGRTSRLSVLV